MNINLNLPIALEPVLAKIRAVTDLSTATYYEVVFHSGLKWCSYADSKTFDNGETVLRWRYVKEVLNES